MSSRPAFLRKSPLLRILTFPAPVLSHYDRLWRRAIWGTHGVILNYFKELGSVALLIIVVRHAIRYKRGGVGAVEESLQSLGEWLGPLAIVLMGIFLWQLFVAAYSVHRDDVSAETAKHEEAEKERDTAREGLRAALEEIRVLKEGRPRLMPEYESNVTPFDRWIEGGPNGAGRIGHHVLICNRNPVPIHNLRLQIESMSFMFDNGPVQGDFPCFLVEGKQLNIGDSEPFVFLISTGSGMGGVTSVENECLRESIPVDLFLQDRRGNPLKLHDHLRIVFRCTSADTDPVRFEIAMSYEAGFLDGQLRMLPDDDTVRESGSVY